MNISEIKQIISISKDNPDLSEKELIDKVLDAYDTVSRPGLYRILSRACDVHGKAVEEIITQSNRPERVRVRQQYCLLAWLFGYSETATGNIIYRDHSTAHVAKKKALSYYALEKDYRQEVDALIDMFPEYSDRLHKRIEDLMQ